MPQIIVAADRGAAFGQGTVTLREGVTVADFQSEHFAAQLVERLGWAVEDADQLEQVPDKGEHTADVARTSELPHTADMAHTAEPPRTAEIENIVEDPKPARRERAEDRVPVTAR